MDSADKAWRPQKNLWENPLEHGLSIPAPRSEKARVLQQFKDMVNQISSKPIAEKGMVATTLDVSKHIHEIDAYAVLKQRQLFIEGEQISEAVNGYASMVEHLLKMGKSTGLKSVKRTLVNMYEPLSKAIALEVEKIEQGVKGLDRQVFPRYQVLIFHN